MPKKGYKQTEEHKRKISEVNEGKKCPEHSKRMSGKNNPMHEKNRSEKVKKSQSEKNRGDKNPNFGNRNTNTLVWNNWTYQRIHYTIKTLKIKPECCKICGKKTKILYCSYNLPHFKRNPLYYSLNPAYYTYRCNSCHQIFDNNSFWSKWNKEKIQKYTKILKILKQNWPYRIERKILKIFYKKCEKGEKKIKKLIEYRRVSTLTQREKNTIKRQEILNKKFLEMNKDKYIIEKVFIDNGISGFKTGETDRPGYYNLIEYLENHDEVDGILVLEIDRLGRNSSELMKFKEKAKKLNKIVIEAVSGMIYAFETPLQEFIFENMSSISSFIGKRLKNKLQFMRKVEYNLHPEKFGRPKKEIPQKLKEKMIHWYKIQKNGFKRISNLIMVENISQYPDWFQRKYPKGFGKPELVEQEDGKFIREKKFYLSSVSVGHRLKEWGIKIKEVNKSKKIEKE